MADEPPRWTDDELTMQLCNALDKELGTGNMWQRIGAELGKFGLFRIASLKTAQQKQVCAAVSAVVGEDCADAFTKELQKALGVKFEVPPVIVGGAKKEKKPGDSYRVRKFAATVEENNPIWEGEYELTEEDLKEFDHIKGLKPYSGARVWTSTMEKEVTGALQKLIVLKIKSPYLKQNYVAAEKLCNAVTKKMGTLSHRKGRTDYSLLTYMIRKATNVVTLKGQSGKHVSEPSPPPPPPAPRAQPRGEHRCGTRGERPRDCLPDGASAIPGGKQRGRLRSRSRTCSDMRPMVLCTS